MRVYLYLPASLLSVVHAKWLECEKSMESMALLHCSCPHWSRLDISAVIALLDFPPSVASRKA